MKPHRYEVSLVVISVLFFSQSTAEGKQKGRSFQRCAAQRQPEIRAPVWSGEVPTEKAAQVILAHFWGLEWVPEQENVNTWYISPKLIRHARDCRATPPENNKDEENMLGVTSKTSLRLEKSQGVYKTRNECIWRAQIKLLPCSRVSNHFQYRAR